MSEQKHPYYSSGVFKVDYESAGYKDLKKIATKRAEDENFYFLEVRKVSPNNWGIQFSYFNPNILEKDYIEKSEWPIRHIYKKELSALYGDWFYARDYTEWNKTPTWNVIVSKAIPL